MPGRSGRNTNGEGPFWIVVDDLKQFEVVKVGIRTGPTATLLTFFLEFMKLLSLKPFKRAAYFFFAWLVWPLRYLDVWLNRKPDAHILANHIYALVRKPNAPNAKS